MSDLKSFCTTWLKAWTGNNPDHLLTFYTDDAFYSDPAKPQGITSREGLRHYFQKLLAKNPHWVWEAEEIFPTEKGFILKWQATIPNNLKTIIKNGMDIVELKDGKICRNEVYFDPQDLT